VTTITTAVAATITTKHTHTHTYIHTHGDTHNINNNSDNNDNNNNSNNDNNNDNNNNDNNNNNSSNDDSTTNNNSNNNNNNSNNNNNNNNMSTNNMTIVNTARVRSGGNYISTYMFMSWLWFDTYIVSLVIADENLRNGTFTECQQSIVPTTNQSPSFLRSGGRLSDTEKADLRRRFNRYVQYFWNITCTHTLPYKIVHILTSIVLHGRTEEYDGFTIKHKHHISPAIGSEIVVDYGQQYFEESTVLCICNKCTEGISHSSSSHNSDNSDSEYISN
jgi:hypothetical protein